MCISCGCGIPEDSHGDERNITLSDLRAAAEAARISMFQLAGNLQQGLTVHSAETDKLAQNIESMNQPLPNGQFAGKLESTPYEE
jgi:hypothetical protein